MRYGTQKPKKPQIFKYKFGRPEAGDKLIRVRDLYHALGNSDQYPVQIGEAMKRNTPEGKIVSETLDAVNAAIEACPTITISHLSDQEASHE